MLILISPAKNLDFSVAEEGLEQTKPLFQKHIKELSTVTRTLTRTDLSNLMGISEKLSDLNYERFQTFKATGKAQSAKQAVLSFNGDVYQGLEAKTLTTDNLAFAQDHLRILSGLYGILRPMDMMQPYRLEMGTRLKTERGTTLYDFWGDSISKEINKTLKDHQSPVVVNLASQEYFKAVDKKALTAHVITPQFKEEKDGTSRTIGLFAKRARGLMARWIIENRIEDVSELKNFKIAGYKFKKAQSDDKTLIFARPQPAKKAG